MNKEKGHLVDRVTAGSIADSAGIKVGWKLLRIDNHTIEDIIDYKIKEADYRLRLLFLTEEGSLRRIKIKKAPGNSLGLRFDPPTISRLQSCRNNCLFCFIDQNPPGLRSPLYLKDDDYRLSFLYGNFITLNRLTDSELERIIKLQLSPLYVSVHAMNPETRRTMFGTRHAQQGTENLKRLVKAGIRFHTQLVLCPGYNTGQEMINTIKELEQLGPNILSTALVPVGLTSQRSELPKLEKYSSGKAEDLIDQVNRMQDDFLKKRESRFVFLADEFYNLASRPIPPDIEYEGYPQLENGVGLARNFLDELKSVADQNIPGIESYLKMTLVSGLAAEPQLMELVKLLGSIKNLDVELATIKNNFFGEQVTVSGLLTGSDLLTALQGKTLGDVVLIPDTMLKEDSNLFLDDMTINALEQALQVPVYAISGPLELLSKIREQAAYSNQMQKRGLL